MRHATPDWSRKDIPYDILPGPALLEKGEKEARALGEFMKGKGLRMVYHSPFERAARTAKVIAAMNKIPCIEEKRLAEWRGVDEAEAHVRARMTSLFEQVAKENIEVGPVGLVSHGGPIALLLLELGFPSDELAPYRTMFDTTNPLPPAGAWEIKRSNDREKWKFELVFTPAVHG